MKEDEGIINLWPLRCMGRIQCRENKLKENDKKKDQYGPMLIKWQSFPIDHHQ